MSIFTVIFCIIIPVVVLFLIMWFFMISADNKHRAEIEKEKLEIEKEQKFQEFITAFNKISKETTFPKNKKLVKFESGYKEMLRTEQYIWIEGYEINFFPAKPIGKYNSDLGSIDKIKIVKFPINSIDFYSIEGEIIHENKISGGGGGGSSIGGAVVGGLIAGDSGAIIGSRQKIDSIKSQLVVHDNRKTMFQIINEDKEKQKLYFDKNSFDSFRELIPEKSLDIVNSVKTDQIIKEQNNKKISSSITDQIRELAKLKDEGIISEEEFQEKKKVLLEKI